MAKSKRRKKNKVFKKRGNKSEEKINYPILTSRLRRKIGVVLIFLTAIIIGLSFFDKSGIVGKSLFQGIYILVGKTIFLIPLFLGLAGLVFLKSEKKRLATPIFLAAALLILGISGLLAIRDLTQREGGWLGYISSYPLLNYLGPWVPPIIFSVLILIGLLIFWEFLPHKEVLPKKEIPSQAPQEIVPTASRTLDKIGERKKIEFQMKDITPPLIKRGGARVDELRSSSPYAGARVVDEGLLAEELEGDELAAKESSQYKFPPPDLLEVNHEKAVSAGDIEANSLQIKKTLYDFGIPVEMSEVNVGPTVTQYTLKPAEGIKLSRITALTSNLSLALAAHPLRIEAPIPGRSLVGIEMPNKTRAVVRLRELISSPSFQDSPLPLIFCLGKDVSGKPLFADLGKMPHLLVAGSTGSGKTCAADTLIFSERGMLTFEELCPLPLNSEIDFKLKLITRDGIETTSKNYNNGICQFYKLFTSRGYQIEATAEHPLWVINKDGSQGWKAASLVKKGDYVAISRGPALFGNKMDLSNFKPSKIKGYHRKISFTSKMTSHLSQFLGLLTADGGLSIERKGIHRVVYTQANSYLIRLYKKSLKELFGITQFIEKRAGSNPKNKAKEIEVNSKHLKEFLVYLGMGSWKSPQKEIPRAIREAPKEIVAAYLRALFDNDGYVGKNSIEFCISSKKLAFQVHLILLNFGIISSLLIKKVKNYTYNDYYRLSIFGEEARKFIQEIGFIRKEKYNKAKQFLKLSPNPNVDLIPHISSLLRRMGQKYLNRFARLTNRGWRYQPGILVPKYAFSSLRNYNSGFRAPGYQSLEKILEFYQPISKELEYQQLMEISKRNFYWDKIEKIDRTSGVGYDFRVPGSDSFVGNGFVNHNTICLNSLILSLIYRNSPQTLKFILVDPKRVEFPTYNGLPHLLGPIIFNGQKAVNVLNWLIGEMERRFEVLAAVKARDITSYNKIVRGRQNTTLISFMPYIILIIDELADLMAAKGREIEAGIVRLSQMSRAVGIHLVVATQRPSVDVITGLIKANITSRVAFQVASQIDSRTILDGAGAETLLGGGDMLFISSQLSRPKRIQGAYISPREIKRVVAFCKRESLGEGDEAKASSSPFAIAREKEEQETLEESLEKELTEPVSPSGISMLEDDSLYEEAKRVVIESNKASASLLQRRLRVGYARAARLLDLLEEREVIGPGEGAKPRKVYLKENGSKERDDEWQKV